MFEKPPITLINDQGYRAELTNFEFLSGNKIRVYVTISDPAGNVILIEPAFEVSASKIVAWFKGMKKLDSWNQRPGMVSGKEVLKPLFEELGAVFDLLVRDKLPRRVQS